MGMSMGECTELHTVEWGAGEGGGGLVQTEGTQDEGKDSRRNFLVITEMDYWEFAAGYRVSFSRLD